MHPLVISYPTSHLPYDDTILYTTRGEYRRNSDSEKRRDIFLKFLNRAPPPPDYQKIASSLISINAPLETRRGNVAIPVVPFRVLERWCRKGTGHPVGEVVLAPFFLEDRKGEDLWPWVSRQSSRESVRERKRGTFCKLDYVAFFSLLESSRSPSPFSSTVKLISEDERSCGPHSFGSPFLPSLLSSPPSSFLLFFSLLPPVTPRPAIYIIWNKSLKFVDDPLTLWLLHVEKKRGRRKCQKGGKGMQKRNENTVTTATLMVDK